MHIILLKFGENKASAPEYMADHKAWIAKGISDGIFHCVGSLDVGGGFILAHGECDKEVHARLAADPFVVQGVVSAEILQVDVNHAGPELAFLHATK